MGRASPHVESDPSFIMCRYVTDTLSSSSSLFAKASKQNKHGQNKQQKKARGHLLVKRIFFFFLYIEMEAFLKGTPNPLEVVPTGIQQGETAPLPANLQ